jgi:hypothetical protein
VKLVIWLVSLLIFGLVSHFTGKRTDVEDELTSVPRIDSGHRVDPLVIIPRLSVTCNSHCITTRCLLNPSCAIMQQYQ